MYLYMYKVGMYLKHNMLEKTEYKIMIGFAENVTTFPNQFHSFWNIPKVGMRTKENQIKYNETMKKYGKDWLRASGGSVMLKIYMYLN